MTVNASPRSSSRTTRPPSSPAASSASADRWWPAPRSATRSRCSREAPTAGVAVGPPAQRDPVARPRSRWSCGPPAPSGPPRGPGRRARSSGVSSQVERHRLALLVDHRPALARSLGDDHLVGQHLDRLAVDARRWPARRPPAPRPARRRRPRRSPRRPGASACANRLPSARKLPFALWSTRSAPAADSGSSVPMLSSSATSRRRSSSRAVVGGGRRPGPAAAAGGCAPWPRPGPRDRARRAAARRGPLPTARRRPARRRSAASSRGAPTRAASADVAANMSCQTRSVMNGVIGAISSVTT